MTEHNPLARYCVVVTDPPLPAYLLSDDQCCPACDEGRVLLELDPDYEVLGPHPCPIHGKTLR